MTDYDEQSLAQMLRLLPPAPNAWVRAAQELPLLKQGLGELLTRVEAETAHYAHHRAQQQPKLSNH